VVPMSASMQDLIMARIEHALVSGGWKYAVDCRFTNSGVIRVLNQQTLAPVTEAWFKFGDEGCDFYSGARQAAPLASCYYEPGRYKGSAPWCYATPDEVVVVVYTHLAGGAQ
jgi:hypothetical protein